jgi:epoxide hydrolase
MDIAEERAACTMCGAVTGRAEFVVYADDSVIAFLDREPASIGHTVVTTREHIHYVDEVPADQARHLLAVVQRLGTAISTLHPPQASTGMFLTDGEADFREAPHVHVHVFSKRREPGVPPPTRAVAEHIARALDTIEAPPPQPPDSPGHRSVFWPEHRETTGADVTVPAGEEIRPFRIDIPQSDLDDLHGRLDRARWPDELPGVGWAYGIPREYLRELADYWRHGYDWRAAEARLNQWPQFTTTIDGTSIHFAHLRSPEPDATPLIITHGWPGSIAEFTKVTGLLSDPRAHGGDPADAFDLVLPSIPGFAFSGPTTEAGWEYRRVAAAFAELMRRLGYRRYGAQGGDWGAVISRELGRAHPGQVIGAHLTILVGSAADREPGEQELAALSPAERERTLASWQRSRRWDRDGSGYAAIQSTRPQTLAYALTDSPVGQLAWIAEKFREWTDSAGCPDGAIDRDQLLTNVMLYWLTGTAGSSARIYYERTHAPYWGMPPEPSAVPTAMAVFPHENFIPLRHIADQTNNIVQWTEFERGGHFPAMEEPDLLVADIRAFFRKIRH